MFQMFFALSELLQNQQAVLDAGWSEKKAQESVSF